MGTHKKSVKKENTEVKFERDLEKAVEGDPAAIKRVEKEVDNDSGEALSDALAVDADTGPERELADAIGEPEGEDYTD